MLRRVALEPSTTAAVGTAATIQNVGAAFLSSFLSPAAIFETEPLLWDQNRSNIIVEHEPLKPGSDLRLNTKSGSDLGKHITVSNVSSHRSSASRGHFADIGPTAHRPPTAGVRGFRDSSAEHSGRTPCRSERVLHPRSGRPATRS